jgi:hypothetical protein
MLLLCRRVQRDLHCDQDVAACGSAALFDAGDLWQQQLLQQGGVLQG